MVAIGLVAVLLAIGAPMMTEVTRNVRITGQTNDLIAALQLARSEAVKRNQGVFVCASTDQATCSGTSWSQGWIVFADLNANNVKDVAETPLRVRRALEGNNTLQSAGHINVGGVLYLPYRPTGVSTPSGAMFVLCDNRTTVNVGRRIEVNSTGRPQVTRETCPTTP